MQFTEQLSPSNASPSRSITKINNKANKHSRTNELESSSSTASALLANIGLSISPKQKIDAPGKMGSEARSLSPPRVLTSRILLSRGSRSSRGHHAVCSYAAWQQHPASNATDQSALKSAHFSPNEDKLPPPPPRPLQCARPMRGMSTP